MSSAVPASSTCPDTLIDTLIDNTMHAATNVDPSEVDKFNKLAHQWWDNTGAFAR